ncbi:MAG: sulfotransferase family protein [Bacteroidales bacterium]
MKGNRIIRSRDFRNHPLWFRALNALWKGSYRLGKQPVLDKDELIGAARNETGLKNLGKDFWDEPLERLITSLNQEAALHPIGFFISRKRIINLLSVRLRAEYWFSKHPEILDQQLYPPLVIVGLQRTGTTKLHRLLTADPDNRVIRSWEAINPAPLTQQMNGIDRRIRSAKMSEKALRMMAPGFFAIHPVEHSAPEEDILLLDVTFLSTTPEATAHVPSYASWLERTDQSYAYAYGGKLLQLLQWQQPGVRWILKSPHHLEFMPLIEKYFQQPRFLWTHREMNECIPSFLSMVCHSRTIFSDRVSMQQVRDHWVKKTGYMLEQGMAYRSLPGKQKTVTDILYGDLVNRPIDVLETIYEPYGGIPESLGERFRLADVENPKGKYGIHEYSLEDFGLNNQELIRQNREYHELFTRLIR